MTRALILAMAFLLAGCPIAPDNYGNDGGTTDAGAVADAGATTVVDAGTASGTLTCSISVQNALGESATGGGAWANADLSGSTATTSDGTNYTVAIVGSNTGSGALELEFALPVGSSGQVPASDLLSEDFQSASGLGLQDTWSCASCAYVSINSFTGTTITGTFNAVFPATSSGNTCSLSNGSFSVTFP